ncbi:beta-galactosidase-1-like protein 2 [Watersipora subatra]|uniref:beta-galactosidase-1-like protein 2 n=1 Tax=Watersipora subatra TaxID=2589382 RepID=UPI00355C871C
MKGLEAHSDWFWINGKKTRLFSGAMHYFRIPREYWQDRLIKLRASGCNTLETYIPWNLHEPTRGKYDFQGILDVREYIQLAEKCGLYVIVRPGPYICSEWDLGGLPSWLLRDPQMNLRSNYEPYMAAVKSYFKELLPRLTDLQYGSGKGPIIAWQVENEYLTISKSTDHLAELQKLMLECGCTELLFTSDNEQGLLHGPLKGVLMMANFQDIKLGHDMLELCKARQPGMPRMCMEFWTGWFDHWGDKDHQTWSLDEFNETLTYILKEYGSVNFYMFHGGTNFGFMNGANEQTENDQLQDGQDYLADVTSYDYDALLTEAGATTPKYDRAVQLMSQYSSEVVYLADCPAATPLLKPIKYNDVSLVSHLSLDAVLPLLESSDVKGKPQPMEMLNLNGGAGQAYGWSLYRKRVEASGSLQFVGQVRDRTQVFLDGKPVATFDCNTSDYSTSLPRGGILDLLIENMGRTNYQPIDKDILNNQRKGLNNQVMLNGELLSDWSVYCLDFSEKFLARLLNAKTFKEGSGVMTPALLKGSLEVTAPTPADTFFDMQGWGKGIVLVNGKNLGRYWPSKGPTKTLYVPGPFLKQGLNEVLIFELEKVETKLTMTGSPILG